MVMGDEDGRGPLPPKYGLHLPPHLASHGVVQIAEGLVEEDHHGPGGQGPAQRDPLLLPARYLVRVPVGQPGQLYNVQDLLHPLRPLFGFHFPEAEANVLGDRQVREQCVVLKDHRYPSLLGGNVAALSRCTAVS